jgi:hypothetical protein
MVAEQPFLLRMERQSQKTTIKTTAMQGNQKARQGKVIKIQGNQQDTLETTRHHEPHARDMELRSSGKTKNVDKGKNRKNTGNEKTGKTLSSKFFFLLVFSSSSATEKNSFESFLPDTQNRHDLFTSATTTTLQQD